MVLLTAPPLHRTKISYLAATDTDTSMDSAQGDSRLPRKQKVSQNVSTSPISSVLFVGLLKRLNRTALQHFGLISAGLATWSQSARASKVHKLLRQC